VKERIKLDESGLVMFKGKKDGITIILDEAVEFDELRRVFSEKIGTAKDFFSDSQLSVNFSGRELTPDEKATLIEIMQEETGSAVTEIIKPEPKVDPKPPPPEVKQQTPNTQELNLTVFHKGSLRSGQNINHSGSIVVIGDTNPGSHLTAEGNIIVLGSLKGFAHAGSKGDLSCFIAALNLMPTQIRIGSIITYIPQEMNTRVKQTVPSCAYVEDKQIFIAKL